LLHLQAGQYLFVAAPPLIMPSAIILGSPVVAQVMPGPPDPSRCSFTVVAPTSATPVVGASLAVEVYLADVFGNPLTAWDAQQYNTTRVVVTGECCTADMVRTHIVARAEAVSTKRCRRVVCGAPWRNACNQ
jgi:hypothetical protein